MDNHGSKFLRLLSQVMEKEVEKYGYVEDEICAMDLEEDYVRFFMSDGKVIKIKFDDVRLEEETEGLN